MAVITSVLRTASSRSGTVGAMTISPSSADTLVGSRRKTEVAVVADNGRVADGTQVIKRAVCRGIVDKDQLVRIIGELPNAFDAGLGVVDLVVRQDHDRRQAMVLRLRRDGRDQELINIELFRLVGRQSGDAQTAHIDFARLAARGPFFPERFIRTSIICSCRISAGRRCKSSTPI